MLYFFLLLEYEAEEPQFPDVPESKHGSVSIVEVKTLHRAGFKRF